MKITGVIRSDADTTGDDNALPEIRVIDAHGDNYRHAVQALWHSIPRGWHIVNFRRA
jgi:hypothetical protein